MTTEQGDIHSLDLPALPAPGTESSRQLVLALLKDHGDALWSFCRVRLSSDDITEDVVQETLLAALKSAHKFQGSSSSLTWLLGIASHKIADHFRRSRRTSRELTPDAPVADRPSPDAWFDDRGMWAAAPQKWASARPDRRDDAVLALRECLDRLPPALAELVWLRDVLNMPASAICEALSITATNLWTRMHRARAALRSCIESAISERGRQTP